MEFIKKKLDSLESQKETIWKAIKNIADGENLMLLERHVEHLKKLEAKIITIEFLYQESLKFTQPSKNNLGIGDVSKQRERLIDFAEFAYENRNSDLSDITIDEFLKSNL